MALQFSEAEGEKMIFSVCSQEIYEHIKMICYTEIFEIPQNYFSSVPSCVKKKWTNFTWLSKVKNCTGISESNLSYTSLNFKVFDSFD